MLFLSLPACGMNVHRMCMTEGIATCDCWSGRGKGEVSESEFREGRGGGGKKGGRKGEGREGGGKEGREGGKGEGERREGERWGERVCEEVSERKTWEKEF